MPFISLQLNSNRPRQIQLFFDSIESTADDPQDIEVLLHIDEGDRAMEEVVVAEEKKRRFTLRVLKTSLVKDYSTLWQTLNPLFTLTHADVYFVNVLSDEMLFQTKGWDSVLRKYIGYYPDHIFRLRASQYRFRNYTDVWECGYAPDSITFYTRRWIELQGDWNPCSGPDSFQQCVAFYLYTSDPFSHTQYNRDMPLPALKFTGEGAGVGLEGKAKYARIRINNRAWFILMSHRMQQEAKRRAMLLKSHIIASEKGLDASVSLSESKERKRFELRDGEENLIAQLSYALSWARITLTTISRLPHLLYYQGGGKRGLHYSFFGMIMMLATYMPFGTELLAFCAERGKKAWERWWKGRASFR